MYFEISHVSELKTSDLDGSESPSKKVLYSQLPLCLQDSETSVIAVVKSAVALAMQNRCTSSISFRSEDILFKLDGSVTVWLVWWMGEKV